jgi:type IV fimbrial biogenesis protein FimT
LHAADGVRPTSIGGGCKTQGFSLIELMVVVVITALLFAMGVPAFNNWIAGTRIRSTAEALLAGLQYAKSEAASRNTQVRFQLTTSVDASCAWSVNGTSWVVDVVDTDAAKDSVEGKCDTPASDSNPPSILQVRSGNEATGSTKVSADSATVVFNGLGRLSPTPPAALNIDITPANASDCVAKGGKITCLRIGISTAGQIRMCNPNLPAGQPAACS